MKARMTVFRIIERSGMPKTESGTLTMLTQVERIPPADPPAMDVAVKVFISKSLVMAICLLVSIWLYQHQVCLPGQKYDPTGPCRGCL